MASKCWTISTYHGEDEIFIDSIGNGVMNPKVLSIIGVGGELVVIFTGIYHGRPPVSVHSGEYMGSLRKEDGVSGNGRILSAPEHVSNNMPLAWLASFGNTKERHCHHHWAPIRCRSEYVKVDKLVNKVSCH